MQDSDPKLNSEYVAVRREANLNPEQAKDYERISEDLNGFWALNWERILDSIKALNITVGQKEKLANLIIGYVQKAFKNGNFENLKGVEPVLQFLEIDSIKFSSDYKNRVLALYEKYSPSFLYSMSPDLYDGKLMSGKPYDKIEYTRGLLKKFGAPPEELTDKYIQELWDLREVLVRLHDKLRGQDANSLTGATKKLTGLVKLLS